ncbi:heparinase II/III family protein [Clostridium sp.]|uniref:heparinase II/III family protein n=1 Tax=Clostridium sp. TaxID=1506 RepID=UPI003F38F706
MDHILNGELALLKERVKEYIKTYDIDFVKNYIKGECSKEYRTKLLGANLLLNNSFIFDETWDMEQCRVPYVNNPVDWNFTPNGDEEWIFMLNRHEYLNKLILAYYLEEKDIYIEKWKGLVLDWIEKNKITLKGGKTIRTIDTGIRCQSWLNGLIHLIAIDKIDDKDLLKIINSIKEQIYYLKNSYTDKYILSNWGVLQTTSIISCLLWLREFIDDSELFEWALAQTYAQIELQVFDDGSHWEQSAMYHVEVLNCSMKVISTCEKLGFDLKEEYKSKVLSMAKYLMYCAAPKWTQEAQADSDRTDIRDVLVKAVILFKDKELKWAAFDNLDLNSIFMHGKKGYDVFINIEGEKPKEINKSFDDSGNIYMRSDFNEKSSFTYVKNGTLGSGHGHIDLGHFSLYFDGKPFFVDSGRYTYVEDDKMREYFKSAKAHNVSVIDNDPFGVPVKSWGYEKFPDTLKNYFSCKENISYAETPYIAKLNDGSSYIAVRRVLFISPNIWVIVNDIRCNGNHSITNYYNLDSDVKVKENSEYLSLENENSKLRLYNYNIDEIEIKNSYISKNYNEINNSKRIETKTNFKDLIRNYDIIIGENTNEDIVIKDSGINQFNSLDKVNKDKVIVKTINIGENESYTIIIFNEETYKGAKIYSCEETAVYGKVVVIHKKEGNQKVIRLRG